MPTSCRTMKSPKKKPNPLRTVAVDRGGVNRFCIVVKASCADMQVGDMEWAKALLLLNMLCQREGLPIEAHLSEPSP